MRNLFGYLNTGPGSMDGSGLAADPNANGAVAAEIGRTAGAKYACRAPFELHSERMSVALSGAAIWRGQTVSEGNADRILAELLRQYRRAGNSVLDELDGAFAIAILEPDTRRALLAIDRMGIEALAYARAGDSLIFGSSVAQVAEHAGVRGSLRQQAIFDFLFLHMVPAPNTVYQGVMKLPIATLLSMESGRVKLQRYWEPRYEYQSFRSLEEIKRSTRSALEAGVRASTPGNTSGAFLSGGLDSSSVAGTFRMITQSPIPTFTVGFGDSEHDELRFARIANRHFGNHAHEYQMRPADVLEVFPLIAAAHDEPFGNPSAAPTYFCARLAAENGVTHILAGDGGDELFGGNERYVRHRIFELYHRIPNVVRHGVLEHLTRTMSLESRLVPFRKLRSYVDQARISLPDRFESWNYMYREGGRQILHPEFAEAVDPHGPLLHLRNLWHAAPSTNLLERMLWYDWQHTLADNDLRKVTVMASLVGVRVSFPMLHSSVVNLSTRVPPYMKIKGKTLRSFYKRSMAGFLPEQIIRKKKHGFALPFGAWIKDDPKLGDLFYSHVSDLKRRRIVAASFLDKLIEQHRSGHPYYYGYAIWDLAALQAWLTHHVDNG